MARLPFAVEFDAATATITVDGVKISLALLRTFANPDPRQTYRFIRSGDVVTVVTIPLELDEETTL